jgi:hypothetical protein
MTDENKYHNEEEEDGKPYESIRDWWDEISHLKWPLIVTGILVLILIILIDLNII